MGGSSGGKRSKIKVPAGPNLREIRGAGARVNEVARNQAGNVRNVANTSAGRIERQAKMYADAMGRQSKDYADKMEGLATDRSNTLNEWGEADRRRFDTVFRPLEDRIVKDANTWDSASRIKRETRRAGVSAGNDADLAAQRQQRQEVAMGINPASGRAAALRTRSSNARALTVAGAKNATRDNIMATGQDMRYRAAGLGAGLREGARAGVTGSASVGMQGLTSAGQTRMAGLGAGAATRINGLSTGGNMRVGGAGNAGTMMVGGAASEAAGVTGAAEMQIRERNAALNYNAGVDTANAEANASKWGGIGKIAGAGINLAMGNPVGAFGALAA